MAKSLINPIDKKFPASAPCLVSSFTPMYKQRYLSEFSTEEEKEQARINLGIKDPILSWLDLKGEVLENPSVTNYINSRIPTIDLLKVDDIVTITVHYLGGSNSVSIDTSTIHTDNNTIQTNEAGNIEVKDGSINEDKLSNSVITKLALLDRLSELDKLDELYNILFPLKISISASKTLVEHDSSGVAVSITASVSKKSNPVIADITLKQGNTTETSTGSTFTKVFNVTSLGTTIFNATAKYEGTSVSTSIGVEAVMRFRFGFSTSTDAFTAFEDIGPSGNLSLRSSPKGTYTLSNDTTGKYMWIFVGSNKSVNKITSSGFDIPMESANTSVTNYKAYRSSSSFVDGNVTLTIE